MTKIRASFTPDVELDVPDNELLDLERQHLIVWREGDPDWTNTTPNTSPAASALPTVETNPTPANAVVGTDNGKAAVA